MICFWLGGRGVGGSSEKNSFCLGRSCGKKLHARGGGGGGGSYSFVVAINQIPPAPPCS